MKFCLSEEQTGIQDAVAQLVKRRLSDRGLHEIIDGNRNVEDVLWRDLAALGVLGAAVPEAFGGLGLGVLELALISEILGYEAAPGPFIGHVLAELAISLGGSEAQKSAWLPRLASGDACAAIAFAEPGGVWLPDDWTMAGGATVTGVKTHVVGARRADMLVVGLAGGGLGLVDSGAAGIAQFDLDSVDATRPLSRITFSDTPIELLPGGVNAAPSVIDAGLALIAADAFGGGKRCVEMAVTYAHQREQFGRKIAEFQALRHQLVDMALEVEPCRGLYWFAAHAWDNRDAASGHAAALAKSHIAERVLQVARDNIEAHGGIGFTWEYDAHIWLKRAMFNWAWLGAPPLHRARAADLAGW